MKKVKYGDSYIFVDDEPADEKNTGVVILQGENGTKTNVIETISEEESLENTLTDLRSVIDE